MNIPPFWAKEKFTDTDPHGKTCSFVASGWSFHSPDEYEYLDRPIREEIIETIDVGDGDPALITRNRYGALVLNTAAVCFSACADYMTCALLSRDEPTSSDPRIQRVIEVHDKWVCRDRELPLA